jgi:hypothetical protein
MAHFLNLTEEQLAKIRILERELGDVCLLAVGRAEAFYAVEAKVDRNRWEPIDQAYPAIEGLRAYFLSQDDAKKAKDSLKSLLMSKVGQKFSKRPIRVVKLPRKEAGKSD